MPSMVDQGWYAGLATRSPTLSQILYDLRKKQLEAPIFLCLHCAKETRSQHAMAAHCRQHVQAGMGKDTVEHIKYYPDHTFTFLGNNNPQPSPTQVPGSTAQQGMTQPPMPMNQVPTGGYITGYYTGCFSISDLTRSPLSSRSLFIYGNPLSSGANRVGPSTTPASVPPEIDLTLRLGPTPRQTAEVTTPGIYYPFQISRYF
jgi:hypothetical protein